jgi:phenylacetate-CoA ligase
MSRRACRDIEFAPAAEIRRAQARRLCEHIEYCRRHSPFYRRRLARRRLSFRGGALAALRALPATTKRDLEECNDEFLAVPRTRIADIVLSSGTTGKPTRIMYTARDLARLQRNEELSFAGCGLSSRDVVLLTCTMDRCFVAGLAYFLGVTGLGAAAIRNGHGSLESHLAVIRQMRPTAIVGVPSFLRKLGLFLDAQGFPARAAGVRRLVCIGEPLRGRHLETLKLGADLERVWKAKAYSTYASSETITTFCECSAQQGGHLHPDLAVVEILDDAGNPVPAGAAGEVVVTPLAVEGMPLIRFRTGDVSFVIDEPCACGRVSLRLGPIIGRKKQMMKVRGTTLYPQALYSALDEIPGVSEYYVAATSAESLSDEVTVHVAVDDPACTKELIGDRLQARVRVRPEVVIEPEERVREQVFTPKARKPIRFIDLRGTHG